LASLAIPDGRVGFTGGGEKGKSRMVLEVLKAECQVRRGDLPPADRLP
jgi:hypothetical protein